MAITQRLWERRPVRKRLRGAWDGWLGIAVAFFIVLPLSFALIGGAGVGVYALVDRYDLLDAAGFDGSWDCDEFKSKASAQDKLEHEIAHKDDGSIRKLDPDGNGRACEGWRGKDGAGNLARRKTGFEGVDSTPERLDGSESYEFEQDDLDRAAGASDAVKDYCSGAVSEAQRLGCESHVTDSDLP